MFAPTHEGENVNIVLPIGQAGKTLAILCGLRTIQNRPMFVILPILTIAIPLLVLTPFPSKALDRPFRWQARPIATRWLDCPRHLGNQTSRRCPEMESRSFTTFSARMHG